MMKLKGNSYNYLKLIHIVCGSAWLGGALVILITVNTEFLTTYEALTKYKLIKNIEYFIVFPGTIGCLLTGLVFSAFTNWSFFKKRWITIKYIINIEDILVGSFLIVKLEEKLIEMLNVEGYNILANPDFISKQEVFANLVLLQTSLVILAFFMSVIKPRLFQKKKQTLLAF